MKTAIPYEELPGSPAQNLRTCLLAARLHGIHPDRTVLVINHHRRQIEIAEMKNHGGNVR